VKGRPDLDFFTSVKAKEVTFGKVPERRRLTYYGEPDHETDAEVERENIPEEPEAGVTYRDVKVDWSVAQRVVHPIEEGPDASADDAAASAEEGGKD
jgi:hypothetical protein